MTTPFAQVDHAYVPILLTRRGERIGMRDTAAAVKDRMCPLWVVPPVPWDFENEEPAKSVEAHIARVASDLVRDWGTSDAYLDTHLLDDDDLPTGEHPLEHIIAEAAGDGLRLVPVTGPDRDAAHHAAVARVVALASNAPPRVCLRVRLDDALNLQAPPAAHTWSVSNLLSTIGVQPTEADLVIDFADQAVSNPLAAAALMRSVLASFPHVASWRSITFAATSMPASLQGVATMAITSYSRGESEAWRDLVTGVPALSRPLRFGDYGIQHPDLPNVDPRFMRIFSQIRYAIHDHWLIARGLELRPNGYGHVPTLVALLTARPEFAGPTFSSGDQWFADCAAGSVPAGTPEVWRRNGTNHHFAHVTREVAQVIGIPTP